MNARWLSITASLLLVFLSISVKAQLTWQRSITSAKKIITYSLDRTGNLYVSYENGEITKFSPNLDSLKSFSPERVDQFRLIEAWHGFQIFAFNQKFQDFVLLDRFLTRDTKYSLGETGLFYITLATFSSDQNLWLLEENGLRLVKYDFKSGQVIIDVSLDTWLDNNDHDFTFLREYQNQLYLVDKNSGIYIFDNLGNFIKKSTIAGISSLSFFGENLYYIKEANLIEKGLYSEQLQAFSLDEVKNTGVLVFDKKVYLIQDKAVQLLSFPGN